MEIFKIKNNKLNWKEEIATYLFKNFHKITTKELIL